MNTVQLDDLADATGAPHWWMRTLRGLGRPATHAPPGFDAAAQAGIQRMVTRLEAILDDNWTLIGGFANGGGRLDHILVGPRGVLALACSALNGRIHCDGQRWRRDKFDLYNSLVARDVPVADPAAELFRAAMRLQQVLLGHTSIRHVAMALVFTHPAATLGHVLHARLDLVTLLSDLKSATLLQAMSGQPDHRTIDGVVEVIRHEHARFLRDAGKKRGKRPALFLER